MDNFFAGDTGSRSRFFEVSNSENRKETPAREQDGGIEGLNTADQGDGGVVGEQVEPDKEITQT